MVCTISSYDSLLSIYGVTRRPDVQREVTAIGILHKNLRALVQEIFNSKKPSTTANLVAGLLNNEKNRKVLVVLDAEIPTQAPVSLNLRCLKEEITDVAKIDVDDDIDDLTGDEVLTMLDDACKKVETQQKPIALVKQLFTSAKVPESFPDVSKFKDIGYAYTKDRMGESSTFMQSVLEGNFFSLENKTRYAYPHDSDDLARCMFYVERYLAARERNDLTDAEKQSLSICSSKWSGIMMHLDELREAIRLNKPMDEVTQFLQRCMNDGKTVYVGDEPNAIEDEEKQEIVKFIETLQEGKEEEYRFSLTERSRVFANTLIQELHDRDYFISYTYENHGGVRGTRRLTRGKEVSLLERAEYHYSKRTLKIRKKTEEDNNDSGILEARGFDFGFRF